MTLTSHTRVLALLGDPVLHSRSPEIQNAACTAAGVDGVYVAVRCAPDDLDGFMRGLARAGGGGNVTLPYKEKAASILDVRSEAVRRTGACNTFWGDARGRLHGDNTDVEGFRRAVAIFLDGPVAGIRALVLGAGGAARAALLALLEEGAEEVVLFNRTPERARAVARRIGGEKARVVSAMRELEGADFDLVVNATRVGLDARDPSPMDLRILNRAGAALDVVHGGGSTPFVRAAASVGIRATDGGEMLLRQGAASFECWWGRSAPIDAMRAALAQEGHA